VIPPELEGCIPDFSSGSWRPPDGRASSAALDDYQDALWSDHRRDRSADDESPPTIANYRPRFIPSFLRSLVPSYLLPPSCESLPFTEAKEVIGGYALVDVASREEALKTARDFMELHRVHWPEFEGECEVRQLEDM
jgi:hypothetical protein